ncbi:22018_t:CDS:2 [Rhizophagus irregularis]|nr:22018_t:CDS:2 [Rhizophagus irregularis]
MPLLFEIIEEFQQAEETRLELTQLKKLGPEFSEQSHQKAIYTSRALSSFISKPINLSSMTSSNMKQVFYFNFRIHYKEYEFDINNIQSLSSNNINSAEQCSFNSQYQPQSKPILTITTNSSKKRDIEELKIKTQNDRKRGKTSACCHTTDLNL